MVARGSSPVGRALAAGGLPKPSRSSVHQADAARAAGRWADCRRAMRTLPARAGFRIFIASRQRWQRSGGASDLRSCAKARGVRQDDGAWRPEEGGPYPSWPEGHPQRLLADRRASCSRGGNAALAYCGSQHVRGAVPCSGDPPVGTPVARSSRRLSFPHSSRSGTVGPPMPPHLMICRAGLVMEWRRGRLPGRGRLAPRAVRAATLAV